MQAHGGRFKTLRTIMALVLREMSSTYGRSPGGYVWAILEPAGGIAMLSLGFGLLFRTPSLGVNFPIFYATALLPFMLYRGVSTKVANSIQFSRPLLAYPAVTFVDALLARFLLNTMVYLMIFYVVMGGIHVMFETHTSLDMPAVARSLAMAAGLALGIGSLNCFLFSMFPVWKNVWAIVNRPLFILSTVFYIFEDIPAEYRDWLWYNPLVHIVGEMRRGFYPTYDATYVSYGYIVGLSLVCGSAGIGLLALYYRIIINR